MTGTFLLDGMVVFVACLDVLIPRKIWHWDWSIWSRNVGKNVCKRYITENVMLAF